MIQKALGVLVGVLVLLTLLAVSSANFLMDWWWFESLGLSQLLVNRVLWEWAIRAAAWIGLSALLFVNLLWTRPVLAQALWRFPQIQQYIKQRHLTSIMAGVSVFLGLLYSSGIGFYFWDVVKFFHGGVFGVSDPLFARDIGFYVFELPFYRIFVMAVSGALVLTLLAVAAVYFAAGSFRLTDMKLQVSARAKQHLSILVGIIILLRAAAYRLEVFELVYSASGVVFGAGYTDANIRVWGLYAAAILSVIVGLVFLLQLYRYRVVLVGSIALFFLSNILLLGVVPTVVERWIVEPNQFSRESSYMDYHIDMTRFGYNLDAFRETDFTGDAQLTWDDVEAHRETIDNVRLWDPRPLLQTYSQLQEMRVYYRFMDADVDRYWVNGDYRQVMLSARELDVSQIQNRTWINEHLQYTHGFGVVMNPVNSVTRQGLPEFWIGDIPPRSTVDIEVTQPRIYYGEKTDQYVIANTLTEEFDYPMGDQSAFVHYEGSGGVQLAGFLRQLTASIRFGTPRILLADDITHESRLLFDRNILERVKKIAPFLRYDQDPYLVVGADGHLYWIIDAYSVSDRVPYSQPVAGWGNYVRNSVKVVIDAYNGDVDFYQIEPDPLLDMYASLFPDWLRPLADMPEDLRRHLRYPEDLLSLQARVYGTYHMTNTRVFYNREDVWTFAREVYAGREQEVVPYYNIQRLPGEEDSEFVLMLPMTPARRDNMIAWLAARNDGEHYGEVVVHRFPKETLTLGPAQIEARIDQDSEISQLLSLWGQRGSAVIRGNLLVLPVGEGLLYVEPLFLQSEQSGMPQLQRVIVAHGDEVVMEPTLEMALAELFGAQDQVDMVETVAPDELETAAEELFVDPPTPVDADGDWGRAYELYREAERALRDGDFADFGAAWDELERVLQELYEIE